MVNRAAVDYNDLRNVDMLPDQVQASGREFQFTLNLRVDCEGALWHAAAKHCSLSSAMPVDDIIDLIGPAEDPSIEECLLVLALPSRVAGCEMLDVRLDPCLGGYGRPAVVTPDHH